MFKLKRKIKRSDTYPPFKLDMEKIHSNSKCISSISNSSPRDPETDSDTSISDTKTSWAKKRLSFIRSRSPSTSSKTWDLCSPASSTENTPRIEDSNSIQLFEELGRGSSGVVHRGIYGPFTVACKSIYVESLDAEEKMKTKTNIQKILDLEKHPNIVHYFGCDTSSSTVYYYLIMEYFSMSLDTLMDRKRNTNTQFTLQTVASICKQVTSALSYIHKHDIIHRDIKTENIFLHYNVKDEYKSIAKLGDFGEMVKHKKKLGSKKKRLSCNRGTPEFMAPEIIHPESSEYSNAKYSTKVDIWSFGIVLYKLLCLETPYETEGIEYFQLLEYISTGKRPKWPTNFEKTEENVKFVMLYEKCTDKDQDKRISSRQLYKKFKNVYFEYISK